MNRFNWMIILIILISCSTQDDVSQKYRLFIPVSNSCEGCVRNVVDLLSRCEFENTKVILTSIYSRRDMEFASNFRKQNQLWVSIDSTNRYSSLEKLSIYPVLYRGETKLLTINPDGLKNKLSELKKTLKCNSQK